MGITRFFEELATRAHHRSSFQELLEKQPQDIKNAFLMSDAEYLKNQLANNTVLASQTHVVRLYD